MRRLALLTVSCSLVLGLAGHAHERVSVIDLGSLAGGMQTSGHYLNQRGQVVGKTITGDTGKYQAIIWDRGIMSPIIDASVSEVLSDAMRDLAPGDPRKSFALGINNRGQVVGGVSVGFVNGSEVFRAVLWEGGVMTMLSGLGVPDLPGDSNSAYKINDNGQILVNTSVVLGAGQHQDVAAFLVELYD